MLRVFGILFVRTTIAIFVKLLIPRQLFAIGIIGCFIVFLLEYYLWMYWYCNQVGTFLKGKHLNTLLAVPIIYQAKKLETKIYVETVSL